MRVGLGLLRLSPGAFWAMTPIEFERAIGALAPRHGAPRRDDLGALMRLFPDHASPDHASPDHASPDHASKESGFG